MLITQEIKPRLRRNKSTLVSGIDHKIQDVALTMWNFLGHSIVKSSS